MSNTIQAKLAAFGIYAPAKQASVDELKEVYEANRHRVYSFAFWMTDNELSAEEVSENVFLRVFGLSQAPSEEVVDQLLLAEIREMMPVGVLTLECGVATEVESIRHNVKRVHLERAVVQLPSTERMIFVMHDGEGYPHERIARTIGITEGESRHGLHQARLRIRELVAEMK